MILCRTCLSKNDLKPIFPDKNLVNLRSEQLYLVCGIKIKANDGLTQLICETCINLVNGALKLREQSLKSEETLKKSFVTVKIESDHNYYSQTSQQNKIKIIEFDNQQADKIENQNSKIEQENNKNNETNSKKFCRKMTLDIDSDSKDVVNQQDTDNVYSVRIEDFESSSDSDFMNDFLTTDVDSLKSDDESNKVCIEDYESSDSFELEFEKIIKKETKEVNTVNRDLKVKELLERERRKMHCKEKDKKLLSLAATPYDVGGPIRCTLCNKELRNLPNFKSHAKTHFEPQNACEICGKKFVNPCHMRYHQQRVHGRIKRLACSKCNYRAVDQLQLQNHMRAEHTGERPYVCDVCGDSFRMRANIVQHMRKHFGIKNLQCERCPAMFRSRSELTGHQNRVHNLIYTYFCYLCPETYKRPAVVKKHLVNVHGVPRNQQLQIKCIKSRKN